jgi:hypothetical protein
MKVLMHALAASCEELRARTGNPPLLRGLPRPQSLSKGGEENEKKSAMISQPLIYIVCNCTALCPTKGLRRRQLRGYVLWWPAVLVFGVHYWFGGSLLRGYVLWWPAVLVLEYFLAYSKIGRFIIIIISIHNSNMEYQSCQREGGGGGGGGKCPPKLFFAPPQKIY